jgi:hypothetical protein
LACPLNTDLYFTTQTAMGLSNTFQEAGNVLSITADNGDIDLTGLTGRAGSEVHLAATGTSGLHLGPSSHLYIHPCDGPGNSFDPKMLMTGNTGFPEEEEGGPAELQVFPNPTTGTFTVLLRDADRDQVSDLRLYNGLGTLMLAESMTGDRASVAIHFPDGVYTVVVTHGSEVHATRIILNAHDRD